MPFLVTVSFVAQTEGNHWMIEEQLHMVAQAEGHSVMIEEQLHTVEGQMLGSVSVLTCILYIFFSHIIIIYKFRSLQIVDFDKQTTFIKMDKLLDTFDWLGLSFDMALETFSLQWTRFDPQWSSHFIGQKQQLKCAHVSQNTHTHIHTTKLVCLNSMKFRHISSRACIYIIL